MASVKRMFVTSGVIDYLPDSLEIIKSVVYIFIKQTVMGAT